MMLKLEYCLCIFIILLLAQKPLMADVIGIPSYVLTSSGEILMSAEKNYLHIIVFYYGEGLESLPVFHPNLPVQ